MSNLHPYLKLTIAAALLATADMAGAWSKPANGPLTFRLESAPEGLPPMLSLWQLEEPPDDDDDDDADDIDDDAADPGADDDDDAGGVDDIGDDAGDDDAAGGDDAGDDDAGDDDATGTGDDNGDDDAGEDDDGGANGDADDDRDDDDDGQTAGGGGRAGGRDDDDGGGFRLGGGPARSLGDDRGGRSGRMAETFDLADDEIFDASGYIARRGQLLALDPSDRVLNEARRLGYAVAERFRLPATGLSIARLRLPDDVTASDALASLRAAEPTAVLDYEHLYDFSPSGIDDIDRPSGARLQSRASLSTRADLRVGLIDSAIDPANPSITGARIEQRVFVSTGEPPTREHGTAVASILAGRKDGLLPRGQYFVASVFHQSSRGESIGAAADLARALDWLMSKQTPVINMSLAGPPNAVLEAAIRRAHERGHIVVAAVGNAGPAARPQYPAAYPGVVGVTAIDDAGKIYRRAGRGSHVDFAAPGVAVAAAASDGTDAPVSGTSFAAPYVAAVLATRHTRLDRGAAQVAIADLAREAADLGDAGQDPVYGHGAVPLRAMN